LGQLQFRQFQIKYRLLRGDKDATQLFVEMEPSVIFPLSE
jgi:hypothetical protein